MSALRHDAGYRTLARLGLEAALELIDEDPLTAALHAGFAKSALALECGLEQRHQKQVTAAIERAGDTEDGA